MTPDNIRDAAVTRNQLIYARVCTVTTIKTIRRVETITPEPKLHRVSVIAMTTAKNYSNTLSIAILDADVPVPTVRAVRGLYSDIFAKLLGEALQRIDDVQRHSPRRLQFQAYDCVKGDYPLDPELLDGIIITGSASSAYEDKPWIRALDAYVLDIYRNHPHVKIFGSCFGHQLVCQSLLRDQGVVVEHDPKGWELGVHSIELESKSLRHLPLSLGQLPSFSKRTTQSGSRNSVKVQFVHADHVVSTDGSTELPSPWLPIGRTAHCHNQGVLLPGRVLTLQGHLEFNHFVNSETIRVFGAHWPEDTLRNALASTDSEDDAELIAEIVTSFFGYGETSQNYGLLTPPGDQ